MDKVFEQIGNIKDIYSLLALFIACIMFITWSKWATVSKWISSSFGYIFNVNKPKDKFLKDLLFHGIFYKFEEIKQEVREIEFTTHGNLDTIKTKLLHTLIDCQLNATKESLTCMLKDDRNENVSNDEMKNKIMLLKINILDTYCKRAKTIFINQFGISEEDSEILLDAYSRSRRTFNEHFEAQMIGVVYNESYTNIYQKTSIILELTSMSLCSIPAQSKIAMNEVNGRFLKYKK